MDIKSTNNKRNIKNKLWIIYLILLPVLIMAVFLCSYPRLSEEAEELNENPLESENFVQILYQSNYVLYKNLYEKVHEVKCSYRELYFDFAVPAEKEEAVQEYLSERAIEANEENSLRTPDESYLQSFLAERYPELESNYLGYYEKTFHNLSEILDYTITDDVTGTKISNSGADMSKSEDFYTYVRLSYDASGHVGNIAVKGEQADLFLKRVSEQGRVDVLQSFTDTIEEASLLTVSSKGPANCTIAYGVTYENWERLQAGGSYYSYFDSEMFTIYDFTAVDSYFHSRILNYIDLCLLLIFFLGLFLPMGEKKPWDLKLFRLPLEVILCLAYILLGVRWEFVSNTTELLTGRLAKFFNNQFVLGGMKQTLLAFGINFLFGAAVLMISLYLAYNLRQLRAIGWKRYFKKYCYIYRFFPFIKQQAIKFYNYMMSFDVTTATNKIIIRILLLNGIIVFLICSLWFYGFFGVLIYSVLLYFIMRKYISDLKRKYEILLRATNRIAEGNLNVTIPENLGVFEPFKPQIDKIQEGFRNAVEEEVRSQRMKTELITNVSHDLKTPLTAIITYVDLLKDESLTPEQRREYIDTLERKSLRLKVLIEDLFEVSKANSGSISLNLMDVDVVNLVKQVLFELEEKIQEADLTVRLNVPEEKVILKLDSQKTYRIYENLIGNITKYAMKGTRVYVDVLEDENSVFIGLKNISAMELNVNPMELTERFVRGDSSRNTEGSGLGLAIAKSFVELQNGKMNIELDGDLFKVTTVWHK